MQRSRVFLGWQLCMALLAQPLLSQQTPNQAKGASTPHTERAALKSHSSQALQDDERVLHTLNRLTFGPRPGDLEMVRAIGLDQWFELQLHPADLEYSDLNRRLREFPAMRLATPQLMAAFPSGAILRQTADGKLALPDSPILRTIYTDHIAFYKEREARKIEKKADEPNQDLPQVQMAAGTGANSHGALPGPSPSKSMSDPTLSASQPAIETGKSLADSATKTGPTTVETTVSTILALPPDQRVSRLLAMSPLALEEFRAAIKGPQRAQLLDKMTPGQREVVLDLENPTKAVLDEMLEQRLTRDIYSPAQLQEVMTDFWLNHFNVYLHKNEETPYYLVSFERDVIRPRALGRFEDLLVATAESPAMMLYLDNSSSMGPDSIVSEKEKQRAAKQNKPAPPSGLNENYARELMELHTLGVNGGYTQQDVTEMARVFTGWTVDQPTHGGGFLFDERKHEPGTKKLLGVKVKEGGQDEGLAMLHLLAMRPATARFLCRKLAIRFVADDPPQGLVDRMAKSYLASGGDISTVLRTMFHAPEFWQREVYRAKVKTPLEYVVSAVRASSAETGSLMPMANNLNQMGMPLYGCVPPTGYSAKDEAWVSTGSLVNRMNFALALAANRLPEIRTGWSAAADESELAREVDIDNAQMDMAAEERRLEDRLVQGGVSEHTRQAVLEEAVNPAGVQNATAQPVTASTKTPGRPAYVRPTANAFNAREKQDALLAGLLLGSPEFQRR